MELGTLKMQKASSNPNSNEDVKKETIIPEIEYKSESKNQTELMEEGKSQLKPRYRSNGN